MDYLNPNSLLDRGQGIYGETGFGESVDQGILRQLQTENQMRQANASTELSQALTRGKLPNELAQSNLEGARANLLRDPKYLQLFLDQFQGGADKSFAEGSLARAGLPQKIANQQQTLGIENTRNAQLIKDIDALTASGQVPPQVAQIAKVLAMNGGKAPNMSNPLSTFGAFQGLGGQQEAAGSSMSARIAKLMEQANPAYQGKVAEKGLDYTKEIAKDSIREAGDLQKTNIHAGVQAKSEFFRTLQLVGAEAKQAESIAKDKATQLAARIKEAQNDLSSLNKKDPQYAVLQGQIKAAQEAKDRADKAAEAAAGRVSQLNQVAVSRLGLPKDVVDRIFGPSTLPDNPQPQPTGGKLRWDPTTGKVVSGELEQPKPEQNYQRSTYGIPSDLVPSSINLDTDISALFRGTGRNREGH